MIKVGICGLGFMGWIHYLAYRRVSGVTLVAVSDPIEKRLTGDWRDIKGNFGPQGEMVDLSGMGRYPDYHQLFADPNVDMVDICLPPAMHADAAVAALQAGKHVLCEKPMALTTADCRRMVEAAEKAGRMLCIGHVLQFFPEYAEAIKLIRSGQYGRLLGGTFKRVISDPLWMKDFYDPNRCGGPLIDLHIHDAHLIRLLYGMPTGLVSCGRTHGEVVAYCQTLFRFSDPTLVVGATSGVIQQQGRVFTHGFEIHLEKATLHYEFAALVDHNESMPLKVLTAEGDVVRPQLGEVDDITAFAAEISEAVRAIQANRPSPLLGGDLARDAVILAHKQTESVKQGRPVEI